LLLITALVAQIVMAHLGSHDKNHPMGDVSFAYHPWIDYMLNTGKMLGLNAAWVYPYPALVPLWIAHFISPKPRDYLTGWIIMAITLNMLALVWLVLRNKNTVRLGWFWLAATVALGPVSLSRLDGISVAIALVALSLLIHHNFAQSTVWFTIATWLKVWPAAILAALATPSGNRKRVLLGAVLTSVAFVGVGFLVGGNLNIFSFITKQDARGIQIESIVAMPWIWKAVGHHGARIYYDTHILAFQVKGAGVDVVAASMNWWLLFALAISMALTLLASWRKIPLGELMAEAALLFTLDLMLFDKVGSPQYLGWLIIPVMMGMYFRVRGWWPAVVGVLAATVLTQLIYPVNYEALIRAHFWPAVLLTCRNSLEVLLLLWSAWRLSRLAFKKSAQQTTDDFVLD
jgi:hypothetical protein